MNNLKCAKVYIKKKRYPDFYNFLLSYSVASKHLTNNIRWYLKQIFLMPKEIRIELEQSWINDHILRGNKELNGKMLYTTGIYYELINQPESFINDEGRELYNFAIKYPKNPLQQLIRREINIHFAFLKKIKKKEKTNLVKYIKDDTFSSIFSEASFKHKYYQTKDSTRSLNQNHLAKLSNNKKNNLYTKIQLLSKSNKIEWQLEKGLFFVQSIQTDIVDENTAVLHLIYDDYEQNWNNKNVLDSFEESFMTVEKELSKEKDLKKKRALLRKKLKLKNKLEQKLSNSLVKRTYKNKSKKQIMPHKITSVDPGVTNLFTLTTIDVKSGDSNAVQIKKTEYTTVFSGIDLKIEQAKSKKDLYIETIFKKHSRLGQTLSDEDIHKLKVPGWQRQTIKKMTEKERSEFQNLNNEISLFFSHRKKRMFSLAHQMSSKIVDFVKKQGASILVLGKNKEGKTAMKGRNWNSIPHFFIYQLITYKARENGIKVVYQQESYSSMLSSLDFDDVNLKVGSGKRDEKNPSIFRLKDKTIMDAGVNGAFNILRFYYIKRCKNHKTWDSDFMRKVRVNLTQKPAVLSLT